MPIQSIESGDLLFRIENDIGIITFNRPESRNALTFDMYDQVRSLSLELVNSRDIKALVVHGAGDKAFAAGTDISGFRNFSSAEDALAYERQMDEVLDAFEKIPVPTIAAIFGACTGGGAAIASACDIRFSNDRLKYGFPIARTLGNCLSNQNLSRQIWLLGASKVKELMLTARLMEAPEALTAGLVSKISDDPLAEALKLADTLKGHAPLTMTATKEAMRRLRNESITSEDRDLIVQCYTSEDFHEGIEAFLAKRTPHWSGK